MRVALLFAALLAASPAAAQSLDVPSGTYKADPTHTSVLWKVSHLGFSTYTGMVQRAAIDASVTLDAQNVANSKLDVTVDGTEIATLHPTDLDPRKTDFDAEIESGMFLNTAANPDITFRSTGIEVTGENTANINGELTFNGQTHPLTLTTRLNRAANHPMMGVPVLGIDATGVIKRSQYGVNTLLGPVSDEVTLEITGEFVKQN